ATRACRRHDTASARRRWREGSTSSRAGQRPAARFRRPTRFSCREQDVSASSKRRKLARRRPLDLMKGDLDYSKFTLPRVHFYADRKTASTSNSSMSELESDMQPLAEEIIAAPATSLGGLRAKALVALWEALPVYSGGHGGSLPMKAAMTVFAKSLAGGGGTSFADWVRVLVERSWGSGPQARPAIPLVHLSRPEAQRSAPLSLRLLSIAALQKFRASQRNHAGLNRSASRLALDSRYQRSS